MRQVRRCAYTLVGCLPKGAAAFEDELSANRK
jgi:hypothetical protein